jgi:hypothetical protein
MGIYELDISWAATANELRGLHWALLTCERVRGVFTTARSDAFAVLFDGDRRSFAAWARTVEPGLEEALP